MESQPVELRGGYSLPRTVAFLSESVLSVAVWARGKPHVRVFPARLFFGAFGVSALIRYFHSQNTEPAERGFSLSEIARALLFFRATARWHGAEHKVFEAYRSRGTTDRESIRAESRISRFCSGRFVVPMLALGYLAHRDCVKRRVSPKVSSALGIAAIVGLDRALDLCRHAWYVKPSEILQRYVTTAEPNERELLTAKAALDALISAHANEEAAA